MEVLQLLLSLVFIIGCMFFMAKISNRFGRSGAHCLWFIIPIAGFWIFWIILARTKTSKEGDAA